jgi:hypothetical protein
LLNETPEITEGFGRIITYLRAIAAVRSLSHEALRDARQSVVYLDAIALKDPLSIDIRQSSRAWIAGPEPST